MAEHSLPYRDIHSELSSVFSVPQPVDTSIESIRRQVRRDIPNALDTILLLQGGAQTEIASNGEGGAIPLFPAITETRLLTDPVALRNFQKQEAILRSLTDYEYFPISHVRLHKDGGSISEFSLAFVKPTLKHPISYELQGALARLDDADTSEGEFYISEFREDRDVPRQPIKLDAELALSLIDAACLQHGSNEAPDSLEEKLFYLIDQSASKTIRRSGEYSILGGEAILEAAHSELMTRKIGKSVTRLCGYSARLQRGHAGPEEVTGVTSTLSIEYDMSSVPRFTAFYDMIVNDTHQTMNRDERTALFHERFLLYRSRPELFFDEITATLENTTGLSRSDQDGLDTPDAG